MQRYAKYFLITLCAIFTGTIAGSVQAQSVLLEPNSAAAIQLEALRPSSFGTDVSNTTFTFFLSGRFQLGRNHFLRAELPFVNYEEEEGYDVYWGDYPYYLPPEDDSQIGNPYLGLDAGNPDNGWQGEFGFRLPVVSEFSETAAAGSMSDYTERLEAFMPDLLPLYLGVNYRLRTDNGFGMRLRMVPVLWLWVGDSKDADTDVHVQYSAQFWYEDRKVGVGGGITGRAIATGDASGFDERTMHQFAFFANYSFGSWMPGFQMRFPLDDRFRAQGVNPTYSLSLGYKL